MHTNTKYKIQYTIDIEYLIAATIKIIRKIRDLVLHTHTGREEKRQKKNKEKEICIFIPCRK